MGLVHEMDETKGGVKLQEAHDECPEDIRGFIFNGRKPIRWHRLADFQSLSIKLIGEAIVRAMPMRTDQRRQRSRNMSRKECTRGDELYFAGDVTLSGLEF